MTVLDLIDVLEQCAQFLDNYADVVDGEDGQPRPNHALVLLDLISETQEHLARYDYLLVPRIGPRP